MPNFKVNKPLKLEVFCGDFGLMKSKKLTWSHVSFFRLRF